MNIDAINETIEVLEEVIRLEDLRDDGTKFFDMREWGTNLPESAVAMDHEISCNTVGCIAGWASVASGFRCEDNAKARDLFATSARVRDAAAEFLGLSEAMAEFLGLSEAMAGDLFAPGFRGSVLPWAAREEADALFDSITARDSIKVLEILRDTGEIRWGEVLGDRASQWEAK